MATTIKIKRSSGTAAPGTLIDGELAVTNAGNNGTAANAGDRLFVGNGSSVVQIGGKYYTDLMDHAHGTLTASSGIITDSNKAVDDLIVGNHATTGGSMEFKEGTNNGTHHIELKAPNAITANVTLTLPGDDGTADQFLQTNGSGTMSWATVQSDFTLDADSGTNQTFSTGSTLNFEGGAGIDTTVSANKINIAAELASDSNVGAASFNTADFAVSGAGDVTVKASGISNTQLAGSIANSKLANDDLKIPFP